MEYPKINLIDVGSSDTIEKPWSFKYIDNFLSFDPLGYEWRSDKIKRKSIRLALFDKNEIRDFYVYRKRSCSSLFKIDPRIAFESRGRRHMWRYEIEETIQVECVRLGDILSKEDVEYDFLKSDCQGADYNVLAGAGEYLSSSIIGVHVEAYHSKFYQCSKVFVDIDKLLKVHGFRLVKNLREPDGRMGDFLYLKDTEEKQDKIDTIKKIYKLDEQEDT